MEPISLGMLALGAAGGLTASGLFGKKKGKVYVPDWSKQGKAIKGGLYKSLLKDLYPADLSAQFKGQAKKMVQSYAKTTGEALEKGRITGPDNVVSGGVINNLLSTMQDRLTMSQAGAQQAGASKKQFRLRRLSGLGSLIGLENQKRLALMQGAAQKNTMSQAAGAQQGAALGQLAQLAMLATIM